MPDEKKDEYELLSDSNEDAGVVMMTTEVTESDKSVSASESGKSGDSNFKANKSDDSANPLYPQMVKTSRFDQY